MKLFEVNMSYTISSADQIPGIIAQKENPNPKLKIVVSGEKAM
jgi:hypothetical protein